MAYLGRRWRLQGKERSAVPEEEAPPVGWGEVVDAWWADEDRNTDVWRRDSMNNLTQNNMLEDGICYSVMAIMTTLH